MTKISKLLKTGAGDENRTRNQQLGRLSRLLLSKHLGATEPFSRPPENIGFSSLARLLECNWSDNFPASCGAVVRG